MQDRILRMLRDRRSQVRRSWEALLRVEPVVSPLANPDTLIHMLDHTFDELIAAQNAAPLAEASAAFFDCPCGRNPLISYFAAGRQAMHEWLVRVQAEVSGLTTTERDAALMKLNAAFRRIANRDIEAFCGVCQFRQGARAAPRWGNGDKPEDPLFPS
jgi:hypothetical protein